MLSLLRLKRFNRQLRSVKKFIMREKSAPWHQVRFTEEKTESKVR